MTEKPICIIPARGGSKRIPRKNIALFNERPLIGWSIETAMKSGVFSRVLVSTDDKEIADIAKGFGAEIPHMRSMRLADDFTSTAEVLLDALEKIDHGKAACCLYPTAPLLVAEDFQNAFDQLTKSNADSVVAVTEYDFHPLRAFETGRDGSLDFKWRENALTRSQDLPELLHDAGAFYFFDTAQFTSQKKLIMGKTFGYKIDRMRAVDIDTPKDFEFAELLHRHQFKVLS